MTPDPASAIVRILEKHETELLEDWLREQQSSGADRPDLIRPAELREQSREFIELLREAVTKGDTSDTRGPNWEPVRSMLAEISRTRGLQGFSPRDVALFVFSFKRPLFARLRAEISDPDTLFREIWAATALLDELGYWTADVYQRTREDVISRQQQEMLELSTPVVKLWDGILAVPLIGTLDSNRTQVVMETLLQEIVTTGSEIAIIDITGVPTVDTLVAQHLLKTIAAARLMGAECIISGIRPQIAQTIVHLGVDLGTVVTKASLAEAFRLALHRTGRVIGRAPKSGD
jgi:rsbT co-antagonist protein RsbR